MKKFFLDLNYKPIILAILIAVFEIWLHPKCYRNYVILFLIAGFGLMTLGTIFAIYRIRMDRKINIRSLLYSLSVPFFVAMILIAHAELKETVSECYKERIDNDKSKINK